MSEHDYGTGQGDEARERLWAYEDFTAAEEHPGFDVTGAFASLGFLRDALRRTARAWCLAGMLGLLLGGALFAAEPPAHTASASVMLTNSPDEDPLSAITTDQALAESHAVAALVVRQLSLPETAAQFMASYTVTVVTNQVLQINASGGSPGEAVRRTQATVTGFLRFRAGMLRSQEMLQAKVLNQMVSNSQQRLDALNSRLAALKEQGATRTQVDRLTKQVDTAAAQAQSLKQTVQAQISATQVSTAAQINNSQVLNPATALPHSRLKFLLYYMVTGLFGGLVLAMAIVVIRELVSDRMRRRDDVADALGAPVTLSVGSVGARRIAFAAGPRTRAARRQNLSRLSAHLRQVLATAGRRPSALLIVTIDNARLVAPAVVSLAESYAKKDRRVIVADLVPGAPVARLLGMNDPGSELVGREGRRFYAYVPNPENVVPAGLLRAVAEQTAVPPEEELLSASRTADVILTVTDVDPALGAEHLATWASEAVAVVTAGLSHAARVYAVGEMLRLARVRLLSAVLTDSDSGDESVGVPQEPPVVAPSVAARNGARPPVVSG